MGFQLLAVSRAATTAHQSPVWFTRLACALTLCSCLSCGDPGPAQDEAMASGKTVVDFRQPAVDFPGVAPNNSLRDHDYFRDMDGRVELTNEEVLGRNTWLVWTAGNQAFWDFLANRSFGALDLLKLLSSYPYQRGDHPGYGFSRDNRFAYLGLMNEPEFEKPSGPDEFGLWLDRRRPDARPEPFDEAVYGQASGVVGLRLFPNPAFDHGARARWDPERYYTDRDYYYDRDLVRPYRRPAALPRLRWRALANAVTNPQILPHERVEPLAQLGWLGRREIKCFAVRKGAAMLRTIPPIHGLPTWSSLLVLAWPRRSAACSPPDVCPRDPVRRLRTTVRCQSSVVTPLLEVE